MEAACVGADPKLFDHNGGDQVWTALSYCERCSVTRACEDYVKPRKSWYDGVVAGKVWREGTLVDPGMFSEGEK
jgi:hypothetical protein